MSGKGQKLPGVRYIGGSNGFRGFEGLCLAEPTPEMREGPVCAQSCWQRWPAGARVGWTAWVGSRTHKTHPSTHGDAPNPSPVPAQRGVELGPAQWRPALCIGLRAKLNSRRGAVR